MVSNFGMISIFALGRCLSLTMMSMAVHMGDFGMGDEFGCPRCFGTWCPNYVASPKTRKISVFFRTVLLLARSVRVQAKKLIRMTSRCVHVREKKSFFFFPLTGVNDGGIFSGGWSPHMDYPVARWWDEFGCPLRVIQIGI